MRSGQKCVASRNKASSMKIVLQIFVDGALFLEEVTSVPAVCRFQEVGEAGCLSLFLSE